MTAIPILLALALSGDGPPPSPDWHYVLPEAGDPFEHPPLRALPLTRERPEDLVEKVAYRGDPAKRRYAQIRFGSPGSIRITAVLDVAGPGDADLYVDADRNRRIDDRDRVTACPGTGRAKLWRIPMDVAMVEGENTTTVRRAAIFRLGTTGHTLAFAVSGYLEGTAELVGTDGKPHPVRARRVDGDGNGRVADPQDRLWIDADGDGRFDASAEQFLFTTVLSLGGSRQIVRSDELGRRLSLAPLVGVGSLQLKWKDAAELHATAVGRDGSVYGLDGKAPTTVPVGEYRLGSLTVAMDDPGGGRRWTFVFTDNGARGEPHWYRVEKDAGATIDPVGTPHFELEVADKVVGPRRPGDDVPLQPRLTTADGLLINVAYRGEPASPAMQERLGSRLSLCGPSSSEVLSASHSGFS